MQTENPVSERSPKAVVDDVFVFAGTAGFRPKRRWPGWQGRAVTYK